MDGLNSVLEQNVSIFFSKIRRKMDITFTIDARFVEVTSHVLADFPKMFVKETRKLELFE